MPSRASGCDVGEQLVLSVQGLNKTFRLPGGLPLHAVVDVDLQLERGSALGVVGESGSGKSTLARMIVGLESPTSGTIEVCGQDRSRPPRSHGERLARARQLQIVFQDPYTSLDSRQTVRQCIDEVLRLHSDHLSNHGPVDVGALLALVGLPERVLDVRPAQLSGGQRQRVAITRALAVRPEVLVLDEAVSALDVSVQAQILNLLADLREQVGTALLFISHDLGVIRQLTDQAIVMRSGVVIERGSTAELIDTPLHPYTQALVSSIPSAGWVPARFDRTQFNAPPATRPTMSVREE
jgi:oligopeptide transport system ATP-binding protein